MQRELAALQASMSANMEKIRVETAEAYEREARLLRELRDQAQEDAGRAKVALSELQVGRGGVCDMFATSADARYRVASPCNNCEQSTVVLMTVQDVHEKSQLHSAELQRRLESQITEMQTEAKQRAFELSHMKARARHTHKNKITRKKQTLAVIVWVTLLLALLLTLLLKHSRASRAHHQHISPPRQMGMELTGHENSGVATADRGRLCANPENPVWAAVCRWCWVRRRTC